ncbi:type II 3-dehydroquinate dehydratase [Endozoicomonas sp. G2_1]|uniref:type II 3-dehydroquinate dehydratase n=1 Tax=Endozoicomonas sp. G2_1 TaxID=2821091 RepID=UPI001ADBCD70|nr:type II 3-dehydroquinate dehydratase [Endozoicomonas sp. G2_1]MBO9489666.1 type II 3-dehydroquinate dehydratase [Endozoicomonas sp. G2_1]
MTAKYKILVLNGPNLNMLGKREPALYGSQTLADIIDDLTKISATLSVELSHFQSNSEADLINAIHQAHQQIDFIIINPAAFTHTSVALRDALLSVSIPFIEVHLSNVHAREPFRQHSYLSDVAKGVICGLGAQGYQFALTAAVNQLTTNSCQSN